MYDLKKCAVVHTVISILESLLEEDGCEFKISLGYEFKTSLVYESRFCLKQN